MNKWLSWILNYVQYFFIFLGVTFLTQELWNWFEGDSLIRNAVVMTIGIMVFDLIKLLFGKVTRSKGESI